MMRRNTIVGSVLLTLSIVVAVAMLPDKRASGGQVAAIFALARCATANRCEVI
jgi:hypothetical protein